MADAEGIRQHAVPVAKKVLHFPDSDGRFLPENHRQAEAVVSLRSDLQAHFDGVRDVTVRGNHFIYCDPDEPKRSVAPDVFVVLGHRTDSRGSYKLWDERKPPDLVVEVISPSSEVHNRTEKKNLYASLGVKEYLIFQPDPEQPGPRLVGYELWGKEYMEVPGELGPGGALEIPSDRLGVSLRVEGERLRVRNLKTGRDYEWHTDLHRKFIASERDCRMAEEQSRREAQARRVAERRIAELEARLKDSTR